MNRHFIISIVIGAYVLVDEAVAKSVLDPVGIEKQRVGGNIDDGECNNIVNSRKGVDEILGHLISGHAWICKIDGVQIRTLVEKKLL